MLLKTGSFDQSRALDDQTFGELLGVKPSLGHGTFSVKTPAAGASRLRTPADLPPESL